MKVHKAFSSVKKMLSDMDLLEKAVYIVKAGMEDEKIFRSMKDVTEDDLNYFSMVVVRK
jgi:precorrin-2/cobalt-factor-2 C20-methyltransferase